MEYNLSFSPFSLKLIFWFILSKIKLFSDHNHFFHCSTVFYDDWFTSIHFMNLYFTLRLSISLQVVNSKCKVLMNIQESISTTKRNVNRACVNFYARRKLLFITTTVMIWMNLSEVMCPVTRYRSVYPRHIHKVRILGQLSWEYHIQNNLVDILRMCSTNRSAKTTRVRTKV